MKVKSENGKGAERDRVHQTMWAGMRAPWGRHVAEQCEIQALEDPEIYRNPHPQFTILSTFTDESPAQTVASLPIY